MKENSPICARLAATPTPSPTPTPTPTPTDVAWAQDFLDDFEARGRVIRDGSDLPRLGRAQKIQRLAQAFGVEAR